jgi:peptide/nickel transport system substrate-binding protein
VLDRLRQGSRRRRVTRFAAVVAAVALGTTALAGTAGAARGAAKSGGTVTFGLEAETTGGFCLPKAQLAISGIQVVAAVYDTLTVPNDKGKYVPYLAKSVTPDSTFTNWTITLRPGIKFQNGETLDAAALKANLDAFQHGVLIGIVLGFVDHSEVVDPMTVKVVLKQPVPDFPAYLYLTGRAGISAPAQLNDTANCATNLIGTGPFMCTPNCASAYKPNESFTLVKNPNYWQKGFPKADKIVFVPVVDGSQRVNELQGGQLDMMHTSGAKQIDQLRSLGNVKLLTQKPGVREIRYYLVNSAKPPFDDPDARQALALAIDRKTVNQITNKGLFEVANSIMDRNVPGYMSNAGYPAFNLKKAQALVTKVKAAHGGQFNVTFLTTTDPDNIQEAQVLKQMVEKAGMSATIAQFDQSGLINEALGGNFSVLLWRNLHGGSTQFPDADTYPWFSNTSPVNFGKFKDDQTQALLDQGRQAQNPADIKRIYSQWNKLMAKQVYILPGWFVNWTIGYQPNVTVTLPPLPDGQGKPLFVYGRIPVLGLSKA